MTDFIGFDPKNYTDEELLDRSIELTRRITWAYRMGGQSVIYQLQAQKLAIEMEQRERMFRVGIGNRILNSPSVVVETDPDLAAVHKADREREIAAANPQPRGRPKPMAVQKDRVRPTSQPTPDRDSD